MNHVKATFLRYMLHPLFLGSVVAYLSNKMAIGYSGYDLGWFMTGHFNDIFLIPVLVPVWAVAMSILTKCECVVTGKDVFSLFAVWSVLFEVAFPLFGMNVGDVWDVIAYATGAIFFVWYHEPKWDVK